MSVVLRIWHCSKFSVNISSGTIALCVGVGSGACVRACVRVCACACVCVSVYMSAHVRGVGVSARGRGRI